MKNLVLNIRKRYMRFLALCIWGILNVTTTSAQNITLDGYVFEENNRGFLNEVRITVLDFVGLVVASDTTDLDGRFSVQVPFGRDYIILSEKRVFKTQYDTIYSSKVKIGEKTFAKIQLERQPGYLFEVTLAEKRVYSNAPADAVSGARVEIYNNTTKQTVLTIDSTKNPVFSYTFEQGNHYTILARKKGYFNKRMEAHVNIDGCILCFEGVGTVTPGIVENISTAKNNQLGTLLANVELDRVDSTRIMIMNNIYYDVASPNLRADAKKELDKLATMLKINPHILVEIGSHTDARGSAEANMTLSKARAQTAVDYLISKGNLKPNRIKAKGYGESQLVNHCKDGITCNDEQHEQNRRTELKIVGISADPFADISLAEIIHAEELEKFVASGDAFSETVYQAPSSVQTAPVVAVTVPKPNNETTKPKVVETPTFTVATIEKAPINADSIKSKVEKSIATAKIPAIKPYPSPTVAPKTEKKNDKKISKPEPKVEQKLPTRVAVVPKTENTPPSVAAAPTVIKEVVREVPKEIAKETPKPIEEKIADFSSVKNGDLAAKGSPSSLPNNAIMKVVVTPIPADFAGYSVELLALPTELKKDSPELQAIAEQVSSTIFIEKRANGVSYTVGNFETWGEVQDFQTKAALKYPKAKVVEYFKGKRIE